mmetsp:Transcript_25221/g.83339  ORF Transcript_25221/g.83339 Transcript_25221/m.83339 type:complete len:93 (-) Transcript_25221:2538-2816(-)
MQRVLMEFNSVTEVESLRKCNRTLRTLVDEHPKLWKHVTFSPPGLARLSRHGEMLQAEKILRKGASSRQAIAGSDVQQVPRKGTLRRRSCWH